MTYMNPIQTCKLQLLDNFADMKRPQWCSCTLKMFNKHMFKIKMTTIKTNPNNLDLSLGPHNSFCCLMLAAAAAAAGGLVDAELPASVVTAAL